MSTVVRLRRWPPARGSEAKRWAVEWETASTYQHEVFADELHARARYELARREQARESIARAREYVQSALALGGDDGADHRPR